VTLVRISSRIITDGGMTIGGDIIREIHKAGGDELTCFFAKIILGIYSEPQQHRQQRDTSRPRRRHSFGPVKSTTTHQGGTHDEI
jgi:hypothetical protein